MRSGKLWREELNNVTGRLSKKDAVTMYKGFSFDLNSNLFCRGFYYPINRTVRIPFWQQIEICKSGFHACYTLEQTFDYKIPTLLQSYVYFKVLCWGRYNAASDKACFSRMKVHQIVSSNHLSNALYELSYGCGRNKEFSIRFSKEYLLTINKYFYNYEK